MANLHAHVQTVGGVSSLIRDRGVQSVARAAVGDYTLNWQAGSAARAAEYHFSLTPIGVAARILQLATTGDNAGIRVLAFDAAGAAVDCDFLFSAEEI